MLNKIFLILIKKLFFKQMIIKLLKRYQFESKFLREIYAYLYNIKIGMYSYGCFNYPDIPINTIIGRYCSFGPGIKIFNANHPSEYIFLHPYMYNISLGLVKKEPFERTKLIIGHDVWIGANVIILPSVKKIGNGVIIGAGSIVTKNIPDFAVVVGNPAKIIKYRFEYHIQKKILESKVYYINKNEFTKNLNFFDNKDNFEEYITKEQYEK
jgi:acetyltransferase-like isoleucine patch superfamily enzyme